MSTTCSGPATTGPATCWATPPCSRAMVDVEEAWLAALVGGRHRARTAAAADLDRPGRRRRRSPRWPRPPRPAATRSSRWSRCCATGSRRRSPTPPRWLHRGLTSQDVLDTALVLLRCATPPNACRDELDAPGRRARRPRPAAPRRRRWSARTLTQHAVPITFGLKAAGLAAPACSTPRDDRRRPALAGPARRRGRHPGRAPVELAVRTGAGEPVRALTCGRRHRARSAWTPRPRGTPRAHAVTRVGDALVRVHRRVGPDRQRRADPVPARDRRAARSRPARAGRLLDDAAQGQPGARRRWSAAPRWPRPRSAAQLHLAPPRRSTSAPTAAWHAEWAALRTLLGRRTVVAAAQTTELLAGLQVDTDRMRRHPRRRGRATSTPSSAALAELRPGPTRTPTRRPTSARPDALVDAVLARAARACGRKESRDPRADHRRPLDRTPADRADCRCWCSGRRSARRPRRCGRRCAAALAGRLRRRRLGPARPRHTTAPCRRSRSRSPSLADGVLRRGRPTSRRGDPAAVRLRRRLRRRRGRPAAAARRAGSGSPRRPCCAPGRGSAPPRRGTSGSRQVRASGTPALVEARRSAGSAPASSTASPERGSALLHALADADDAGLRAGLRGARRRSTSATGSARDQAPRCSRSPAPHDVGHARRPDLREIADRRPGRPARRARRRRRTSPRPRRRRRSPGWSASTRTASRADRRSRRAPGMAVRREVLGDEHVDRATAAATDVTARLPGVHHRVRLGRDLDPARPRPARSGR